jgi:hypothetical protein
VCPPHTIDPSASVFGEAPMELSALDSQINFVDAQIRPVGYVRKVKDGMLFINNIDI